MQVLDLPLRITFIGLLFPHKKKYMQCKVFLLCQLAKTLGFLPISQLVYKECWGGNSVHPWRIIWYAKIENICLHRCYSFNWGNSQMYFTVPCWQSHLCFPTVGWRRTSPRLCRTTQRNPDAVAPFNSQTLPHTSFWVLKSRHAGGGSRGTAELGCWELEGRNVNPIHISSSVLKPSFSWQQVGDINVSNCFW